MQTTHPLLEQIAPHDQTLRRQVSVSVLVPVYNERYLVAASLRRVLELESDLISRLEVIVVDDHSRDGSWEIVQALAESDGRVSAHRQPRNSGKGAALRTALQYATGDVCVVHDADMEYNPGDIPALLRPFVEEGADAVFGSRYLAADYRRVLMYRHTRINRFLSTLSGWLTDLDLTDVETCYKVVNTELLKSIPLRSNDFRFEIELAFKLAKRRARIFEVPIRYLPRTYEEGKKIRPSDGLKALATMAKYSVIDDIYQRDAYGSNILADLHHARRFNKWLGDTLRPFLGDRVLEVGAGIGDLTGQFIPRSLYLASDVNPHHLHYLRAYSIGKPYLRVLRLDATNAADFAPLNGQFDTALLVNVLEHLPDEAAALRNLWNALEPGGRIVILTPNHPNLYGTLDAALEHRERYTPENLRRSLEMAGFRVEHLADFNRTAVPAWWLNGKLLKKTSFSRVQLKTLETLMPLVRRFDRFLPWKGLSLIAVGVKTDAKPA